MATVAQVATLWSLMRDLPEEFATGNAFWMGAVWVFWGVCSGFWVLYAETRSVRRAKQGWQREPGLCGPMKDSWIFRLEGGGRGGGRC